MAHRSGCTHAKTQQWSSDIIRLVFRAGSGARSADSKRRTILSSCMHSHACAVMAARQPRSFSKRHDGLKSTSICNLHFLHPHHPTVTSDGQDGFECLHQVRSARRPLLRARRHQWLNHHDSVLQQDLSNDGLAQSQSALRQRPAPFSALSRRTAPSRHVLHHPSGRFRSSDRQGAKGCPRTLACAGDTASRRRCTALIPVTLARHVRRKGQEGAPLASGLH